VKKAPFLVAVQAVVGGVEVDHDLFRTARLALNVEVHQGLVGGLKIERDFLVAGGAAGLGGRELEPVERAFAGPGLAAVALAAAFFAFQVALARQHRQQRIGAQAVVIVEVLVTQRQAVDPLADQLAHGVLDRVGIAVVLKAGGELAQDAGFLLDFVQQQGAAIGADGSAVEAGDDLAFEISGEGEGSLGTLCHSESRFALAWILLDTLILSQIVRLSLFFGEKSGLVLRA